MNAPNDLMLLVEGFPRPDWQTIVRLIEEHPEATHSEHWRSWASKWLEETRCSLPSTYSISESENFCVLSSEPERYVTLLISFFEKALVRICRDLEGIVIDEGYGKHIAMIFSDQETYYRYISYFYPKDGEFALSSGVFLNKEYGHFVFPFLEMNEAEATAAHELTHACLKHLDLPLWLNEGIAVTMEDAICGSQPLRMTDERLAEHQNFWNFKTIQEFWNGDSFGRTDKGCSLSYELGRYCVRSLSHDYAAFKSFANIALYEDGGEAAAIEVFGGSLGGLIEQFFGEGNWAPSPDEWNAQSAI